MSHCLFNFIRSFRRNWAFVKLSCYYTLAASAKPRASRTSAQVWGGLDVVTSLSPLPRVSLASIIWRLRRVSQGLTLDYG